MSAERQSGELHVGDMVNEPATPGVEFMVIRILPGGIIRIRQWPILQAPLARDVEISTVEFVERPGLVLPSNTSPVNDTNEAGRKPRHELPSGGRLTTAVGGGNE